jgi:hypothetical protein
MNSRKAIATINLVIETINIIRLCMINTNPKKYSKFQF